jgi:TRAP-type C4-dicarboxylate transport system substrate-binding protein
MRTKLLRKSLVAICITISAFGLILYGQLAAAKTYTFKIDTFWGPEFHAVKNSILPALEAIEKESAGQIEFKPFFAQSLAKSTEGYDATAMGMVDIYTLTGPNYETGSMTRGAIFSLPFSLPLGKENVKAATNIMKQVYEEQVIEEIDKNIVVVGLGVLSEYRYMTNNKVEKFEDLNGMTIRSSGGYHDDIIRAANASPEAMGPGDIYEALEKGILDGVFHTYAAQFGWGTFEPMNYSTDLGLATFPYYTVMNKQKFDSLPDDLKAILLKNFSVSGVETAFSYYNNEEEHFGEMGLEEVVLDDAVKQQFYEATILPVWNKWIAECEERNIDWRAIIKSLESAWKANNLEPPNTWVSLAD